MFALGGAAVACGLTLAGSAPEETSEGHEDASAISPHDAALDTGGDGDEQPPTEDAGCVPVVVDDPLTTLDTTRWLTSSEQVDYPTPKDPGIGTTMVAINPVMQPSQRAGLWLRQPVPTTAFDVSFDYLLACTDGQYCADGMAAAWVDTNDAGTLSNGGGGKALGIPKLSGGAAAIKLDVKLSAPDLAEDTFPSVMVHAMDAGPSDKTPTKVQRLDTLVGELRTVTLRLRKGQLTVSTSNDAGDAITVVGPTRSGFVGYFGFSAATGSHYDAAYVGSFHGKFYSCEPQN
jgi:hypothetical protein